MFRVHGKLLMVALYVGVVQSWDIALSVKEQLIFYTNGTKTSSVNLISQNPTSLVYDEVHNMMLYVDKQNNNDTICGYDLSSKDNKCFIKRNGRNIQGLAFDPVTEKIFFTDANEKSINLISKKRSNINGELLIKMDDQAPAAIAVDSCKGYIYWTHTYTDGKIEKAQFDGSDRKVISLPRSYYKPFSLAVDLHIQKMIYFDVCEECTNMHGYLNKANMDGSDEEILLTGFYGSQSLSNVLTVSKDYIYLVNSNESYDSVWQLPKNEANHDIEPKEISKFYSEKILGIVAKYKTEDQIQGIQDCDSLSSLIPSAAPGESCNVSVCVNYCLQGNCSVNDDELPECSCKAGYSGERCEVSVCHGFCLNDGECSLNEDDEPVCQCVGNHAGLRCEDDINDTTATNDLAKRNLTLIDILSTWRKPSSKLYLVVEV